MLAILSFGLVQPPFFVLGLENGEIRKSCFLAIEVLLDFKIKIPNVLGSPFILMKTVSVEKFLLTISSFLNQLLNFLFVISVQIRVFGNLCISFVIDFIIHRKMVAAKILGAHHSPNV